MHIIGMILSPDGRIDNAGTATIAEAVANGYEVGANAGLYEALSYQLDAEVNMYPNPATDAAIVSWTGIEVNKMYIQNMNGQIVYEQGATTNQMKVNVSDLSAGVYLVVLETSANQHITKRLMVN